MKGVWKRGHHTDYIKRIQEYDEKKSVPTSLITEMK